MYSTGTGFENKGYQMVGDYEQVYEDSGHVKAKNL